MDSTDQIVKLKITDVVYPGRGLARLDGCVVFIPGVLPGETVAARITRQRKNYAEAEIISIEIPSPLRIKPACGLSSICPGCVYQHIDYAEEPRIKQAQFIDLLRRIGGISEPPCLDPLPSPHPLGYRNRITLHSAREPADGGDKDPGINLGYFGRDNRSAIDLPACPLAVDPINRELSRLRDDREFMAGLNDGQNLILRFTRSDGTLSWLEGSAPDRAILTEETCLGPVSVPYNGFFQVNIPVADALIGSLMEILSEIRPSALIDLYCGMGLFALAAGKTGIPAVLGIDRDQAAIRAARKNAERHGLPGLRFESISAPAGLKFGFLPLKPEETALIIDPPRAGLTRQIIRMIADYRPRTVIYISCAPDTLARDIARLSDRGYGIESTQIFDMFPRTPYFESLTVLSSAPLEKHFYHEGHPEFFGVDCVYEEIKKIKKKY